MWMEKLKAATAALTMEVNVCVWADMRMLLLVSE
jgi:hypothetical protein